LRDLFQIMLCLAILLGYFSFAVNESSRRRVNARTTKKLLDERMRAEMGKRALPP
jgi:hypothetical protein